MLGDYVQLGMDQIHTLNTTAIFCYIIFDIIKKGDRMSKLCLNNNTVMGLLLLGGGVVLLLLGYFKNFLSVLVVLGALAAIGYGAVILGLHHKVLNFFHIFTHKK